MTSPVGNESSDDLRSDLKAIAESARAGFSRTWSVREKALRLSREIIRLSALSIRATHRADLQLGDGLLDEVSALTRRVVQLLEDHPTIFYAGYVQDAFKEYAEAATTIAIVKGDRLPGSDELDVGPAPYLNGLAETVGELRRFILDSLRRDDIDRCEELLGVMDEIYSVLVSMDFPDAVTRGLRRSTDMARGILERTRGDLTVALRQRRLERKLAALQKALTDRPRG